MTLTDYIERAQRQLDFIKANMRNSAKHVEVASTVQALFSTVNHATAYWPAAKHTEGFDPTCDLCKDEDK